METGSDFQKQLAELEAKYNAAPPASEDIIVDGEYQLRIEQATLKNFEGKGIKVIMQWQCMTPGPMEGKYCTTWDNLNNDQSIKFFKEKLKRLKIDPNTPLSGLEVVLADLPMTLVTAQVKNTTGSRGDMVFTNVNIKSVDGKDMSTGGV